MESELNTEKLPTLVEVGKTLPIAGVDFALREWDWSFEEELGDVLEKRPNLNVGEYISEVVCRALTRVGDIDFDKVKHAQKRSLLRDMHFADVLYMYVWVRVDGLGKELKLEPFKCESCGDLVNYVGDLSTIEVKCHGSGPATKTIELQHGLKYVGEIRKSVKVGPIKWAFMEDKDVARKFRNPAKFKASTIQHGVFEIDGVPPPIMFTPDVLRSMSTKEITKLVREIDQCDGGAVMEISGNCECGKEFLHPIDWTYNDFFGRSVP